MLRIALEHSWRWRESNPRPSASQWDFSERSRRKDLGLLVVAGIGEEPQSAEVSLCGPLTELLR